MTKSPILCDLDGVVWLMHQPIAGSVEAIAQLREAGHRVLFVTNNSAARVEQQEAALENIGIPAAGDVCTSAQAAALLLRSSERVVVAGGPGIVQAVEAVDAIVAARTDGGESDEEFFEQAEEVSTVVVGYHRTFDYRGLTRASTLVMRGARLIGTNDDPTYPTPAGLIPGGGSILAAFATAGGVQPVVAGKPFAPMGDLVRARLGVEDLSDAWMVGDRDSTDGAFARHIGAKFARVTSGVRETLMPSGPEPHGVYEDLAALARELLAPR
jgi:HAD superfamily hydrolase (TIGR01450 family)